MKEEMKQIKRIQNLQEWLMELFQEESITQEELQTFQESLFDLIAMIAETSLGGMMQLQQEKAVQLMDSIQYQIAYHLNQSDDLCWRVNQIKSSHISKLFQAGHELLIQDARAGEAMANQLVESMLSVGNQAYEATLTKGLPEFFEEYDVVFKAHELPGEFDYPLCLPVEHRSGYDYVKEYLDHFAWEEEFLKCFCESDLQAMLQGYSRDYAYLSINLFELVLANRIAHLLLGSSKEEMVKLTMTKKMRESIQAILKQQGWMQLCDQAEERLTQYFAQDSVNVSGECRKYCLEALDKILLRCQNCARTDTLDQLIVIPKRFCEPSVTVYDTSERMTEEAMNQLKQELDAFESGKDKLTAIRKRVHNMDDLIVLLSESVYGEEAKELFIQLSNRDLAKLMMHVLDESQRTDGLNYDGSANWHMELLLTIQSMNVVRQQEINQLITKMKNE